MLNKLYIIRTLIDVADETYREPRLGLDSKEFEERSTRKWAVNTVIETVYESNDPIYALGRLQRMIRKYKPNTKEKAFIFSILDNTIDWAMDIINAMKGEQE